MVTYNGESTSPVVYMATAEPSANLQVLAAYMYIVKVYAPMWFSIKGKPSCKDDARHLLRPIQLSRYLSVEHKLIVDPVIQRNAYFAYPENLLLSMTTEIVSIYANWQFVAFLKVRSSSRTSV